MTLTQVWGALLILTVCPILGGLPLIAWITKALTGSQLAELGTGNIGVSAAFYHGGRLAGILAVLSEAGKGIAAVLLARFFFPSNPEWELISLIALVLGRYWIGKGAGTTNAVWGFIVHDPAAAGLVFLIGSISFTILRERQLGRLAVLVLFPLILAVRHPHEGARFAGAISLALLLAWIYRNIPDDLDLPAEHSQANSQKMFRFFRGDRAIVSLHRQLDAGKVGEKAATLSQLLRWGYPVPAGWVLPPGDDPQPLVDFLQPAPDKPLAVRSSAVGEDSEVASAAGQYESILNVSSREELQDAIARCLASYDRPAAQAYRRDRHLREDAMAVLVQEQIRGVFSGVAFSRDPIYRQGEAVAIEALPGDCSRIVGGRVTPEQYRVFVRDEDVDGATSWVMPPGKLLEMEGAGDVPPALIQQVAFLARHLERRYRGVPQDIEWTYDGRHLWLLQARPVTTLVPVWTRKIAAEVIPGLIRPLTWSINRPLTCGVWGEIFTLVLGAGAAGLDFNETATLHYSRAYFNASLLGEIFLRMGLPPESLEFLTRGARFSKPPLSSTLRQLPGLLRLMGRELRLEKDFERDCRQYFMPVLEDLAKPVSPVSPPALLQRADSILEALKRATYYSILAPLSLALRQAVLKVPDGELDKSLLPEIAATRAIGELAAACRAGAFGEGLLREVTEELISDSGAVFARLGELPGGERVLEEFEGLVERYGYLSDCATDIAVPRWKEEPQPVRELFVQFLRAGAGEGGSEPQRRRGRRGWKVGAVGARVNLKGRVTEVYSRLLAQLRWSFVGLEGVWLESGILGERGDIFFLELEEIRRAVAGDEGLKCRLAELIGLRRGLLEEDRQLSGVAPVVYGNAPPAPLRVRGEGRARRQLRGIGASPGVVEGRVRVLRSLQGMGEIDRLTILVVPYTDSGWAAVLARAGGLIAEVGGRLSHGAIVAREYGMPAVMDVESATDLLRDGEWVRVDGARGVVEIL
ncbi:glycerol-3-phosphate acyltransferase [Kamptonema formosum]|uniref:glycerol-3-phosphate acyltransferase n=1 Tax=Kamptonema formosum TaxID=331992 RepID=UPI00034D3B9B|nr:glycerol-3-phosphate acyltransferase [Oscillatoria sp. PCC 10802]